MSLRGELFGDVVLRPRPRPGGAGLVAVIRDELGDAVCTEAEGDAGDTAITELLTLYRAAGYKPTKYLSAVQAIALERQQLGDSLPAGGFAAGPLTASDFYCRLKALGTRARALYEQIALATGQALTPAPPPEEGFSGAVKALAGAVISAAAIVAVSRFFSDRKAR
jgi:hypothetical protein